MIAKVIIDILNKQVNRTFDYLIPSELEKIIDIGFRVKVPFGKLTRVGYIVDITDNTEYTNKLREIIDLVDVYPVLSKEMIDIAKYIAENYFSYYATVLKAMIPTGLKAKYKRICRVINKDNLPLELHKIFSRKEINLDSIPKEKMPLIYDEIKNNNLKLDIVITKRSDDNEALYVSVLDDSIIPSSKKGKELLNYLCEINEKIELDILVNDCGFSKNVIMTLEKNKIIKIEKERKANYSNDVIYDIKNEKINLNKYQQNVLDNIIFDKSKTYLLHGVTGSGKTEVYMRLIEKALINGKTALLLVPEISLTPQITALFKKRFGSKIAILHSSLTISEQYNEWKKILNKEIKIVVGARSAIFAQLDDLGIIIIDECHERSYIQDNNPKYNAIEIAKLRSKTHNCPLLLGSATPDIVDYYKATNGEYELFSIPVRANNKKMPKSIVVDMKEELISGNKSVYSSLLKEELLKNYKNHEQSILFLNRRGFSSFVMCRSCGETVKCPHCDISLTYHARTQLLKCHYCGFSMPNVYKCKKCGSDKIRFVGSGTEKLEEEAQRIIPEAKIIRLDSDSINGINDYEEAFNKFKNHEADILIGTQMIAKGLDFENVTLVGVVNADLALNFPSYDSTSIAYNLIEQVSGRAGRKNKEGRVIIQTYNPTHYVIESAKNHDYDSFYNQEILNRKSMMLPPFSDVIEMSVISNDASKAYDEAKHIVDTLRMVSNKSTILGPAEALIFKKRDMYTFTIQIQAVEDSIIEKIKYIYPLYQNNKNISISIKRM